MADHDDDEGGGGDDGDDDDDDDEGNDSDDFRAAEFELVDPTDSGHTQHPKSIRFWR